jgi:hypothetical protein
MNEHKTKDLYRSFVCKFQKNMVFNVIFIFSLNLSLKQSFISIDNTDILLFSMVAKLNILKTAFPQTLTYRVIDFGMKPMYLKVWNFLLNKKIGRQPIYFLSAYKEIC